MKTFVVAEIASNWEGSLSKAQKLFDQANTTELNQAILDIRQGEYAKAARYFKNRKSHNAVLAQIMNGNNNVDCNENTGYCHYLNAIAAARKSENSSAINNLTKAISSNASYKTEAEKDLEFVNLKNNEVFQNLIK